MAKSTVKNKFWGCWNQLPIPDKYNYITDSWLKKSDEQLSDFHLLKKTLSRLFFLYITRQHRKWLTAIPTTTKRILWLHISDNLGDSLMRLAPVQLLKDFHVDLYSTKIATELFQENSYFEHIYEIDTDVSQVSQQQYDLVIIDAVQTKPLKKKIAVAKNAPFVSLHELFHFCRDDYNPIYYTWWRMQHLLQNFTILQNTPHLVMDISNDTKQKINQLAISPNSIAIAVGGREDYRTYQNWGAVVELLLQKNPTVNIVLLGSNNGKVIAEKISNKYPVKNYVSQYSLIETAEIIAQCAVLICADGGLLHVANAVNTKTISLFAQELPVWRYVEDDDYCALRADDNVNQIAASDIVSFIKND